MEPPAEGRCGRAFPFNVPSSTRKQKGGGEAVVRRSAVRTMSTKELRRELGRKELMGIACGQIIGAGIMALVGVGIGMTGRSVNIAFVVAAVFVIVLSVPMLFLTSCLRLRGGEYTQAYLLCGPKFAGFWTMIYIVRNIALSVYAISFADYVLSLFPTLPHKAIALGVATFFFVINIFPTKFMAKVQNLMMVFLVAALVLFVVCGWGKIQPGYFQAGEFMTDGPVGLLSASAFLTFAVLGANGIFQLGGECKNPKRDIPFILIVSTLAVAVLYALVGTVAAGVLPLDEVANENLAVVAREIMPEGLFVFFIVGGALGALATTLNANIAWVTKPLIQASEDGWFPKKLAKLHPTYKTPIYLLLLFYLVTILPILCGIDLQSLANVVLLLQYIVMIATSLATVRLPKLFPEEWAKSPYRCNQGMLWFFCIAATLVLIAQVYFNASSLTPLLLGLNAAYMVLAYAYVHFRYKSGKVNMTVSYEET